MKQFLKIVVTAVCLWSFSVAEGKTYRAREMKNADWSNLGKSPEEEMTVEFRQGDYFPMTFAAEGDFLESTKSEISLIHVKRDFWLRAKGDKIEGSLDGRFFRPLNEIMSGQLSAGSGADQAGGPVNALHVLFKANLK